MSIPESFENFNLDDIQDWLQRATGIGDDNKQIAFMVISMVSAIVQHNVMVATCGMDLIRTLVIGESGEEE